MKLKIHQDLRSLLRNLDLDGDTITVPVTLSRDPILNKEASTKRYLNNRLSNLPSSIFNSGIVPVSGLPKFTGDISKPQGSDVITLVDSGVAPGIYTKVTVDAKGRVTSGSSLVESDIPSYPFSKIDQSTLPTTLEGYGILDAIPNTGGNLTGKLKVDVVGTHKDAVINKSFLDNLIATGLQDVPIGTIIMSADATTPDGYLLANGSRVNKTTYADLFAAIGRSYNSTTFTLPDVADIGPLKHYIKF